MDKEQTKFHENLYFGSFHRIFCTLGSMLGGEYKFNKIGFFVKGSGLKSSNIPTFNTLYLFQRWV